MALLRHVQPTAIYLFGSQVTGSIHPESDIDLAVLLPVQHPGVPAVERLRLVGEAERLARRQVDLVVLNQAPLPLQFAVIQTGRVLYEDDFDARTDLEDLIVRDYLDLEPMYERSYREIVGSRAER